MSASGVRHFLDLTEIPKGDLRGMIDASCAMKAKLKRKGSLKKSKRAKPPVVARKRRR